MKSTIVKLFPSLQRARVWVPRRSSRIWCPKLVRAETSTHPPFTSRETEVDGCDLPKVVEQLVSKACPQILTLVISLWYSGQVSFWEEQVLTGCTEVPKVTLRLSEGSTMATTGHGSSGPPGMRVLGPLPAKDSSTRGCGTSAPTKLS